MKHTQRHKFIVQILAAICYISFLITAGAVIALVAMDLVVAALAAITTLIVEGIIAVILAKVME